MAIVMVDGWGGDGDFDGEGMVTVMVRGRDCDGDCDEGMVIVMGKGWRL